MVLDLGCIHYRLEGLGLTSLGVFDSGFRVQASGLFDILLEACPYSI